MSKVNTAKEGAASSANAASKPLVLVLQGFFGSATPAEVLEAAGSEFQILFVIDESSDNPADVMGRVTEAGGTAQILQEMEANPSQSPLARCAGITAFSESHVVTVSRLTASLGLPGHSAEVIERLTNKAVQREALAKQDVPQPLSLMLDLSKPDWRSKIDAMEGKGSLVVKPKVGVGSAGVERVADVASARAVLEKASGFWLVETELIGVPHPDGAWLGDWVSVETVSQNGQHRVIGVMDKLPLAKPFRGTGMVVPSILPDDMRQRCAEVGLAAVKACGVTHGVSSIELKLTAQGPSVIEINGRLGGTTNEAFTRIFGVSAVRAALSAACDLPPVLEFHEQACTICHLFPPAPAEPVDVNEFLAVLPKVQEVKGVYRTDIVNLDALCGGAQTATMTTPVSVWFETASPEDLKIALGEVAKIFLSVGLPIAEREALDDMLSAANGT